LAAVFTVVFTYLIPVQIERFPFFLLCALFPWNFLHMTLTAGTTAIVQSGGLIKKAAFPREAIPIAMVGVQLYHLTIALVLLVGVLAAFGVRFGWGLGWLPVLVLLQTLFVLGVTMLCAAWHTFFRDVKYIVELGLLVWFYLTPIFYPIEALAAPWRWWLVIANPMALFVTLYRQALLWGGVVDVGLLLQAAAISLAAGAIGWLWFRRSAPWFADVV
jgi:ABC-type polysaccharide/polyol phosphate export permease